MSEDFPDKIVSSVLQEGNIFVLSKSGIEHPVPIGVQNGFAFRAPLPESLDHGLEKGFPDLANSRL